MREVWVVHDGAAWRRCSEALASELEHLGLAVRLVGPEEFATWSVVIDGGTLVVSNEVGPVCLPDAVVNFRPPMPEVAGLSDAAAGFVHAQWATMYRGLIFALEEQGVPTLNPTSAARWDEKTAQLQAAHRAGFSTPRTVQTSSGAALAASSLAGELSISAKTFRPFRRSTGPKSFQWTPTRLVDVEAMCRDLDATSYPAPFVLQPFVAAGAEHRVFVVGSEVYGARVDKVGGAAVDVRHADVATVSTSVSVLPDSVSAQCVALTEQCGLDFAVMDLLEVDAANFVFLDLNPGGVYYWVEQRTGQQLTAALARRVIDRVETRERSKVAIGNHS